MAISTKDDNLFRYVHFKPAPLTEKLKASVQKGIDRPKEDISRTRPRDSEQADLRGRRIIALRELEELDLTQDVNLTDPDSMLMLNRIGLSKLSSQTIETLSSMDLDASTMSHLRLTNRINQVLARPDFGKPSHNPGPVPAELEAHIQNVGTARLLVVKQHIIRYEAMEIAHIENVIAGEAKTRTHNRLTRSVEFSSTTAEKTTDTETELETTERFELSKQASKTFQKDTELGLELTVSGKYGPTVSFDSNFNAGQSTSQTQSSEHATNFAKDTIERSKERIVQKVATAIERTLTREVTETNVHHQTNIGQEHTSAIYQYVDKVYQTQVFDYGMRQMFDFMIPEPSSFLWYLKGKTAYRLDTQPPVPLKDMGAEIPKNITKYNYLSLGAAYGVNDLPTPPEIYVTRRIRLAHGDGSTSDETVHKSGVSGSLDIPNGYQPNVARFAVMATSNEALSFAINVGGTIVHVTEADMDETDIGGGHERYAFKNNRAISLGHDTSLDGDQTLFLDIYGYESANYTFHFDVTFYALYDTSQSEYHVVSAWKQEVHGLLAEAYEASLLKYEQERSILEAEAANESRDIVDFGAPPAVNKKLIHTELKKHCLAVIRNEHLGSLNTSHEGEPPEFGVGEAKEVGKTIRFLEHAFEWDQMQYVFYPYYWSRPNSGEGPQESLKGWTDKFSERNSDFTMEEFLKAGCARVVVPVREGFDRAVSYFIENNGAVYSGLGEPEISDPLYLSITDEIRERTGAGKEEIPVGDSWETRLPTAAIIVKEHGTLPRWVSDGSDWGWVSDG